MEGWRSWRSWYAALVRCRTSCRTSCRAARWTEGVLRPRGHARAGPGSAPCHCNGGPERQDAPGGPVVRKMAGQERRGRRSFLASAPVPGDNLRLLHVSSIRREPTGERMVGRIGDGRMQSPWLVMKRMSPGARQRTGRARRPAPDLRTRQRCRGRGSPRPRDG